MFIYDIFIGLLESLDINYTVTLRTFDNIPTFFCSSRETEKRKNPRLIWGIKCTILKMYLKTYDVCIH